MSDTSAQRGDGDAGLVADRACGACNVCCVSLTIDDPELQKLQGHRCRNALRDNGCAIYETRPSTCRTFHCGWRQLSWIREGLRPDVSGVLVGRHVEIAADGTQTAGLMFTLLSSGALKAEGLAETVAAAVTAEIPVYLRVAGRPGFTWGQARMNEVLRDAVLTRDKAGVLDVLARARAKGRHGDHKRIVLTRHPKPDGTASLTSSQDQ